MTTETHRRQAKTKDIAETLLGPAVYAVYLALTYGTNAVICWLGGGTTPAIAEATAVAQNVTFALTLGALAAIVVVASLAVRVLASAEGTPENGQDIVLAAITLGLAVLSALGLLWTGISAMLVPACS